MKSCELERMEVAIPSTQSKPLVGFVEVPTDFITSLTSQRDPLFFGTPEKDNSEELVSTEQEDDLVSTGQKDDVVSTGRVNDVVSTGQVNDIVSTGQVNDVVSTGQVNDVDDSKSDGSEDVQFVGEYASTDSVPVETRAESVIDKNSAGETSSNSNGVSHDDSSSNTLSEVPTRGPNLDNGNSRHSDHNYCGENSTDDSSSDTLSEVPTSDLDNGDSRHNDHNYCGNNSTDSGKAQEVEVVVDPSNSSIDTSTMENNQLIVISDEERKFREELRGHFTFLDYRLHCTICDLHIGAQADLARQEPASLHVFLGVLICNKCKRFGQINQKSTRSGYPSNACSWCYKQELLSELQRCSECPCVFCEKCIRRNLGTRELHSVRRNIDWKCYICACQPIWRLRLVACELLQYIRRKRSHIETSFPYAKPGEIQDADISRCCKSLKNQRAHLPVQNNNHMEQQPSLLKGMLVNYPSANVQVVRPPIPRQYMPVQPKPPLQQSSYATPLFSLTSDFESQSTTYGNVNPTEVQNINNVQFLAPPKISQSSSIAEIQVYKKTNSFSESTNSFLNTPAEPIHGTSGIDIDAQNVRNENLPPLVSVYNRSNSYVRNSAAKNSSNPYFFQKPEPKTSHPNKKKCINLPTQKNAVGQTNKMMPVTGNSSSNVEWINNAILSSSALLDSCRKRLSLIEKAVYNCRSKNDMEIQMAGVLHSFAQLASTKFQEIDSQILENYWLMRKAKGKNYKTLSSDTIAKEFGNIIEDSDNIEEFDPGSFLEVEINGDMGMKSQNSQNGNSENIEGNVRLKSPIVKLHKCDELPSPNKNKLSTTFKSSKKNLVQYSNKIKSLIEKYGILECSVVLVPVQHLKALK